MNPIDWEIVHGNILADAADFRERCWDRVCDSISSGTNHLTWVEGPTRWDVPDVIVSAMNVRILLAVWDAVRALGGRPE